MSWNDFVPDLLNKLLQFEKQGKKDSPVSITMGYDVAHQLRLITKELNHKIPIYSYCSIKQISKHLTVVCIMDHMNGNYLL
jgi:hypothetical protein